MRLQELLRSAGFTKSKAMSQIEVADFIEGVAQQQMTSQKIHMTGSFSESWGSNLVQVNGRISADSDIDWTVMLPGETLHLHGSDDKNKGCQCEVSNRLSVIEGHAQLQVPAGE